MLEGLAFGERQVLLRSVLGRILVDGRRSLVGEEAFEDALCLPLGGVGEVHPHIHASGPAESRVKAFNVISRSEKKSEEHQGSDRRGTEFSQ